MRLPSALLAAAATACTVLAATAAAHELDHPAPAFTVPASPPTSNVLAGGPGARWELVRTIATGNPHSDLDFFTKSGEIYMSAGTLGVGPNAGGQTIVQLTAGGQVSPRYVAAHPSAACPSATTAATGLQHDVEATPKGGTLLNDRTSVAVARDAELLIDSSDSSGRCHDNGTLGASGAPAGGLEIIDITNPAQPKEIGLIRATGNAHTVNVDPKRPHIAFIVTQDGVTVGADGKRANDTSGAGLDGFEVVDLSSCMGFPAGTSIDVKRTLCRPQVFRYRYPSAAVSKSHTYGSMQSCHEVEIYADDRLTCASITATAIFDLSGAFTADGKPKGQPLPCKTVDSSSAATGTRAKVQDCATDLSVSAWLQKGAPSLAGVEWVGTVPHMGFQNGDNSTIVNTPYDARTDIVAAHESEYTQSRRFVITSDERGGGVLPPEAGCSSGADVTRLNGGLHFFPVGNFTTRPPTTAAAAQALWAKQANGQRAVFRATIRRPQATACTAHVFQQIPDQNRIFMGYYSQGTQVLDFVENGDGTVSFKEAGWFIPENANTWTSAIFKMQENPDGSWTYWGATGDGILPGTGRSAIDVYKVTLPAPPRPASTPQGAEGSAAGTSGSARCAVRRGLEAVTVRGRGRGLRIGFRRLERRLVTVDVFRQSSGRRVTGEVLQARFARRTRSFSWSGRRARDGVYVVRLRMALGGGRSDVRRLVVERRDGRWIRRPTYHQPAGCGLIRAAKLERPVFGGRNTNALMISFHLGEPAAVTVTVRDSRGRIARRFDARTYLPRRTHRLRLRPSLIRRGLARVEITARTPSRRESVRLSSRRL